MPRSMFTSSFSPRSSVQLGAAPAGVTSWAAENLCKIVEAASHPSTPEEDKLYQEAFNEWYGKVANVAQHEADTTTFVSKFCPQFMKTYNGMRSQWMQDRERERQGRRPKPPPIPPAGPPVASVDTSYGPPKPAPRPQPPRQPIATRPMQPRPLPPIGPSVPSVDRSYGPVRPSPRPPQPPIVTRPPTSTPGAVSMVQPTPMQAQPTMTQPRDPYNLTPQFQPQSDRYNLTPASMRPATATGQGGCPPGQFPAYPGGPCRGSVAPGAAGLISAAASMAPSATMTPGALTPSMPTGGTMTMMGRTRGGRSMEGVPVKLRGRRADGSIEWWGYQQTFIPELYFARPRVNTAKLAGLPIPPGICCQATQDGGAICSNGQGFPPGCPNKPTPNVPGVAEYVNQGGYMVPKPPTCDATPPAAPKPTEEGGGAAPLIGIAAAGALVYAVVEGLL